MALLALTLALLAITVATGDIPMKPLDMTPDSFDDQYQGCGPAMEEALPALNRSEFQKNLLYAKVWPMAVAEWQKWGSPVSPLSSPDQAIAIMAYTMEDLYKEFNDKVRVTGPAHSAPRTEHFLISYIPSSKSRLLLPRLVAAVASTSLSVVTS
uniref:NAD(P)(+)--arginine ADP-ribosyltransferase n=1 Tax=Catharus ustulatus TaxID=91951 RepID=A0A8C3UHE5_CATUS